LLEPLPAPVDEETELCYNGSIKNDTGKTMHESGKANFHKAAENACAGEGERSMTIDFHGHKHEK
jgi:hypothetical protein